MNSILEKTRGGVGIYGGTFDPLHFGHINLAVNLMESCALEEIWFCPARISPHKQDSTPTNSAHRLKMLELALKDIPEFKILDIELQREGPSYTIDTIKELLEKESKSLSPRQLHLIIGEDALSGLDRWHRVDEIVDTIPLLIGKRQGNDNFKFSSNQKITDAISRGLVETPLMDISATQVRQRIKKDLYCGHLISHKVLDYIHQNDLYFINPNNQLSS
ncbi:MAG: nicotinate-nucleotide adenylyltransferase [Chlamydiales bacterium]|jgi:nicotinate-nucleotide adenylyltransferase